MPTENRSGDYTLSVKADSLTSEPFYALSNTRTGEVFEFNKASLGTIQGLFNGAVPLYPFFVALQSDDLRKENNPVVWNPNLVSSKTPREGATERVLPILNPDSLILKSDTENIKKSSKVPMLKWTHPDSFGEPPQPNEPIKNKANGWNLCFSGLPEVTFAFAEWNDDKGILELVDKMKQPDELMIALALISPKQARGLTEKDDIFRSLMEDLDDIGSRRKTQAEILVNSRKVEKPKVEEKLEELKVSTSISSNRSAGSVLTAPPTKVTFIKKMSRLFSNIK